MTALIWITYYDGNSYLVRVFPQPAEGENLFSPSLYGLDSNYTIISAITDAQPEQQGHTANQHITFSR